MENKINFEQPCPTCSGTGKIQQKDCAACEGRGLVLTDTGKKIVAFLRDSIRLSEH